MPNAYAIIIILFVLGGLATATWGWLILAKARQRRNWPCVEGKIVSAERASDSDDLMPKIVFSYRVASDSFQHELEFPAGTAPSPELTASYLNKYRAGATVKVYYDPAAPGIATLEPSVAGDWLIFVLGLIATLAGVIMLIT